MKKYNIILVYDVEEKHVLMCKRLLEPFKGQLNLVGGKIEAINHLEEAYRELNEETGISKADTSLRHFMDFTYHYYDILLEVYVGKLKHPVDLIEEVNALEWVSLSEDFFSEKYAGDGNIGHILKQIEYDKEEILKTL
ncbi:NUDIX hydrolase [Acidaminobacter sp. JC074]|uniref:NUDIX hydrolase n=1 Tax=Acidaminobacter sp. JC074 TaxID=2530199 RepID=UPI001F0EAE5D|nr:NUDIX hydrolase [Acidaminobacter sp. JC074]MCH4891355.1 NUDIX hydrolase [Acidaminobacter sp. JC074]